MVLVLIFLYQKLALDVKKSSRNLALHAKNQKNGIYKNIQTIFIKNYEKKSKKYSP